MASAVHPTWFGPESNPLFGVAHIPEGGRARGGVLLCPPLGKEHVNTYRGMKLLAQELAASGIAVLRMDYYGVGDSSGDQVDPDAVEGWLRSVQLGTQWLRDIGVEHVGVVGLRVGALILDRAVAECGDIAGAVLWDPIVAGRAYLREQQALYQISIGPDTDGGDVVSTIGMTLHADAAAKLSVLKLEANAANVARWKFVLREGHASKRLSALVEASGADQVEVPGMTDFVTPDSFLVTVSNEGVDAVSSWFDDVFTHETSAVAAQIRTTAAMSDADSPAIVETIEEIGAQGLFGIRTRAVLSMDTSPITLLFCSTANDTRVGPTRIWTELARESARAGAQVLRFDRRGTGESSTVLRDEHTPIYSAESAEDVLEAARAATSDPKDLALVGICSGSWNAAYASRKLGAKSAILINAVAWSWRRKKSSQGKIVPSDLGVPRSDPLWQKTPRARVKAMLQQHLPYFAWRALGARGVTQVPEIILRSLVEKGVDTTVILAPGDYRWFMDQRGEEGLQRLRSGRNVPSIIASGSGDHSAYHGEVRRVVSNHVLDMVRASVPTDDLVAPVSTETPRAVEKLKTIS